MCVGVGGGGVTANDVFRRACTRPTPMSAESRRGCFWCVAGSSIGQGRS